MTEDDGWKTIVASTLDWDQAHLSFDSAIDGMPANLRAAKAEGLPHSVWDILEHIRIAQKDLLDFCSNADYHHELAWPDDYWPATVDRVSDEEWEKSLTQLKHDRVAFKTFTTESGRDLTTKIPGGTGQTYLRTILVAQDHASYHTGELVALRRLLGAWPGDKSK